METLLHHCIVRQAERLWARMALMVGSRLALALFLVNMEISIVTTSIVGITDDLQGFDQSSWLATSYLLTYVGA